MNIKSGSKLIFYISGDKLLVGEAKIRQIERLDPNVAWSNYKGRICLDEEEYNDYVKISPISRRERKMREVTVFKLKDSIKYRKPIRSIYPIAPSGRYITNEMLDKIKGLRD